MKRAKKDPKNKVIYYSNGSHTPKAARFIVRTLTDGSVSLEHHVGANENVISVLADFPKNSLDMNEICKTLKECHKIIGSNHTLYVEMPKWMRARTPLHSITEFL